MRVPLRVLLLAPEDGLVRAVSEIGLEAWTLRRDGARTTGDGTGGVPPERTVTHQDPARFLRDLVAGGQADRDIGFVLCGPGTEPALLDVLRESAPPPGTTWVRPPDRGELERLLAGAPVPPPPLARDGCAPMCWVDTVSVGGMHLVVDVEWPRSPEPREGERWREVRETVRGALDLIGHETGGMRTGVALTTAGPRPVEMTATRFLVASLGPGTTR